VRSSQATGPDNKEIPQSDEQVRQLVKQIIGFRERMMDLLQKSLDRDMTVDLTIKNSFESFINENDKTAKSLVMYLDDQFKKDFKNNTEVEIAEKVDKVIQIFRYLQDKDVFESFYKSSFAKRLLDSRRVLEEAEKEVIKKLKEECGFEFTQRLEVMFKDIKMSE
jgi:cullin 3